MTDRAFSRLVFHVAAISDGLLGALFFFAPSWTFQHIGVADCRSHQPYIHFPVAVPISSRAMLTGNRPGAGSVPAPFRIHTAPP